MTTNSYHTWFPSLSRGRLLEPRLQPALSSQKAVLQRLLQSGRSLGFGISFVGLTICSLAVVRLANAQEPSTADADAAIVQPFVNDATFLIVKVDPTRIGLPDLADTLKSMSPDAEAAYGHFSKQAGAGLELLRALVNDQPVYATVGIPISEDRIPAFALVKKPPEAVAAKLTEFLKSQLKTEYHVRGDYVVVAHVHGLDFAALQAAFPATPREGIADAFEAIASYPAQMLLLPPPYVRRTITELLPELPRQLGGGPSSVLTEGLQWAALGVDPAQLRAEVVIQSASDAAARDLAALLPKMLKAAYDATSEINKQIPPKLSEVLVGWIDPQVEGQRITIRIDGRERLKLLAVIAQTIEEEARRHRNLDRVKQILLGMHNYYDVYKVLPPVDKYRGKDGKHHLSWRVHILPFVEELKLYNQFHLDEPWDSPHNKQLIAKMPDVYMSHSFDIPPKVSIKPGYTTFLAPVGENTVFGGAESTKFSQVRDGTSNTVVLVEVKPERAVPWTAPDDYTFDPEDPAAGLMIGADGRWLCGFADGSVYQPRREITPEMILRLFQMNDGNPIDRNKIR